MTKKTFTEEEVKEECLRYFGGNELAANVAATKYLLKNKKGEYIEKTPDDIHRRLAKEFARIEKKFPNPLSEEEIYNELKGFRNIIPQGSPMAAIGNTEQIMSVSNCFTLPPPDDSYGSIMKTDEQFIQLSKRRGGVGFDLSRLRPGDMPLNNAGRRSTGIKLFMERYSNSSREVGQDARRAALIETINVHHPDILAFIKAKQDEISVTGANVSVRFTDSFMQAVVDNVDYEQFWPMTGPKKISRMVSAREVWNVFIDCSWNRAEPGALFWDTIQRNTPSDAYSEFSAVGVNPCGELILGKFEACRLIAMNLCSFVDNPYRSASSFNYVKFKRSVKIAQRLMDDLVELELEHIDKILDKIESDPESESDKRVERELWEEVRIMAERGRRTGTGMTAMGDTLAMVGSIYGTKESIEIVEDIYREHSIACYESTIELSEERGSFPAYNYETEHDNPYIKSRIELLSDEYKSKYKKFGRRNIALSTTAPTGSLSCLAAIMDLFGTTSGIEPAFLLEYIRRRKLSPSDPEFMVDFVDKLGDKWHNFTVLHSGEGLWRRFNTGTSPYHGGTAMDINWVDGVALQSAAQRHVCHAISKTTNLPKDVSKDVVSDCYMEAWKLQCKGFTVYREGCRSGVLIKNDESESETLSTRSAPRRPKILDCDIHHTSINGEDWIVFIGLLSGNPYEIMGGRASTISIPRKYKAGKIFKQSYKTKNSRYDLFYGEGGKVIDLIKVFDNPEHSVYTRLISLGLRHGSDPSFLVEQLSKDPDSDFKSFTKVIARVLKKYIKDGTKVSSAKACPACSGQLTYQEGCTTCISCGFSKCG